VVVLFAKSFRPDPCLAGRQAQPFLPTSRGQALQGKGVPHAQATAAASAVASPPLKGELEGV